MISHLIHTSKGSLPEYSSSSFQYFLWHHKAQLVSVMRTRGQACSVCVPTYIPPLLFRASLCLCRSLRHLLKDLSGVPALFQGLKILLAGLPIHLDKLPAFKPRHNNAPEQGRSSPLAKMSEQASGCPLSLSSSCLFRKLNAELHLGL